MGRARPLLLALALAAPTALAANAVLPDDAALEGPPKGWPATIEVPELQPAPATGLPEPTLVEPFEIGEALYDPARAEDAALSLLALLGVPIGDGPGRWLRPGPPQGGAPFHLTEREARAFAARAVASANLAAESGEPKLTFANLHGALAPHLSPGWSVQQLADAYQRAYEQHPGDFVPQVLLGQPITPESPLLYPQLWLLLVDGFAPPAGTPRPGRPTPARLARSAGSGWGTAARQIAPELEIFWLRTSPRISLWLYTNLTEITPPTARVHEGHGGPGRPVTIAASLPRSPEPLRDESGQILVDVRRPPALAGVRMIWDSRNWDTLDAHGALSQGFGHVAQADASGTVRNTYTPKSESAQGRGRLVRDEAEVFVRLGFGEVAEALFELAPGMSDWLFSEHDLESRRGALRIEWHELETIDVRIENVYDVKIPLAPMGRAQRRGRDTLWGTLARRPDGTWYGLMNGVVVGRSQVVEGLGVRCPGAGIHVMQKLHVVGTPIDRFGPAHPDSAYVFSPAAPGAPRRTPADFPEKLSLEFLPASAPTYHHGPNRCWPAIPTPLSPDPFIPFNDAQWTIPHAGYGIALPEEGTLTYTEIGGAAAGGPPGSSPSNPLGDALGRLLTTANFGTSTWYVYVDRQREEP